MPEKSTVEKAKEDLREGQSPTTAAGELVHEEIQHVREGKHGGCGDGGACGPSGWAARRALLKPMEWPAAATGLIRFVIRT